MVGDLAGNRLRWLVARRVSRRTSKGRYIDMRDIVARSFMLAGFTPHLTHGLDPGVVYHGT